MSNTGSGIMEKDKEKKTDWVCANGYELWMYVIRGSYYIVDRYVLHLHVYKYGINDTRQRKIRFWVLFYLTYYNTDTYLSPIYYIIYYGLLCTCECVFIYFFIKIGKLSFYLWLEIFIEILLKIQN